MRVATGLLALLLLVGAAAASPRSDLARDFLAFLKANGLTFTVTKQTEDDLELAVGGGKPQIALENLEHYVAEAAAGGKSAAEARREVFTKYLSTLKQMDAPAPTMARDGARVMPRLVAVGYLPADGVVHAGKLGDTGLELAYVLDGERSVRYLTPSDAKSLGVEGAALRALAMKNLGRSLAVAEIRKMIAVGPGEAHVVAKRDTFDAARLLLVQAALKPGESVAALVPDRDTLVLMAVPADGDWSKLREFAKVPPGDPTHALLARPLLLTPAKIEAR